MLRRTFPLLGVILLAFLGSCSDWGGPTNYDGTRTNQVWGLKQVHLKPLNDCDDLLATLHSRMIKVMEQQIDSTLKNRLRACPKPVKYPEHYGSADASTSYSPGPTSTSRTGAENQNSPGQDPTNSNNAPDNDDKGADNYSETNNQVSGVDEADFIKTDGRYIYILANGRFQIVEAFPPMEATRISTVEIEGTPTRLFVKGDRAVLYVSVEPAEFKQEYGYYPNFQGSCTYGYDCDFTGDGKALRMLVFDLTDRSAPKLIRQTKFSGSYLNSRRIGDAVYTVVTFAKKPQTVKLNYRVNFQHTGISTYSCLKEGDDEGEIIAAFDKLKEENRKLIKATTLADWLPSMVDKRFGDEQDRVDAGLLASCSNFYANDEHGTKDNIISLVSFNMSKDDKLHVTSIVGDPGVVYASTDSLYVASRHRFSGNDYWYYDQGQQNDEASTIHKFSLNGDTFSTSYLASGVIKGRLLNQFSMDEFEGHLRIATSNGRVPSPDVHSTISILAHTGKDLKLVGMVDKIAPKEDIRSVRFDGPRGYIVTFKKTDPLFVIDLSAPRAPKILGELKIPGFSTYMHMIDENHLLTIGYDAEDKGSFAWFTGIMLQIFDVTDPTNPKLKHKHIIGTRGSTSDAATNHLAFNFYRHKNLLAIPMNICENSNGGGSYGTEMTFQGLMVFKVSIDSGFTLAGRVEHQLPTVSVSPNGDFNYGTQSCGNWWTRSNSTVKRSIIMDDYVYSVAMDVIKVQHLDDLGTDLRSIPLTIE